MKYFRQKSSAPAAKGPAGPAKHKTAEERAERASSADEPQCRGAIAQRPLERQARDRDPYRKKTGWKRTKKPPPPEGAGDVQVGGTEKLEAEEAGAAGGLAVLAVLAPAEGEQVVAVELHHKGQQTSETCLDPDELYQTPLEDVQTRDQEDEEGQEEEEQEEEEEGGDVSCRTRRTRRTSVVQSRDGAGEGEEEGAVALERGLSSRVSARLTGLASLVELAEAPSEAGSSVVSEDGQGIRHWQRGFLTRLTRARHKRDIRLSRKEVLSLQLMMEAVLKQHMALSREVESVKANLQWESMEPLSLSRALSRLQAERQEEAAASARTLAAKDKSIIKLDRELHTLHQQMSEVQNACREKDEDLERAAVAMATLRGMHQRTLQEQQAAEEERLEAALDKAQQAKDLEVQSTCARYEEHLQRLQCTVAELQVRTQAEVDALRQSLDEKQALLGDVAAETATLRDALRTRDDALGELRAELAKVHSDHNMESLSLSRALTEKEVHIARLMANMDKLAGMHANETKSLREEARERERAAQAALQERRVLDAELQRLRADLDEQLVVVSKALGDRDGDAQQLRDQMEAAHREHEQHEQRLRDAMELLRSEKSVVQLSLEKTVNEKDLRISGLLIDIEHLRTFVAERDAQLQETVAERDNAKLALGRKQVENAGLLNTVEAMNQQHEEMTGKLHHAFAQLESLHQELAKRTSEASASQAEASRLRKEAQDSAAQREKDADQFRKALHEKDVQLREVRDQFQDFQTHKEKQLKAVTEQLEGLEGKVKKKLDGEFGRELEKRERAILELKGKLGQLEESEARIESERETLARALQEKEDDVKVLKNSVEQMKVRHKERSSSAKLDLERKTKEVAELTKTVHSLRTTLDQVKGEHKECAELRQRREAEVDRALRASDRARLQSEETAGKLKQSLLEKEGLLSKLMAKRSKLETEADHLRADVQHHLNQKAGYASVIEEKNKEIAALQDTCALLRSKLQSDCEALSKRAEDRAAETARLQSELEDALESRAALKRKFAKMFKIVRVSFLRRSAERESLEKELERAKAEADDLRGSLLSHEAERDKLGKMMLGKDSEMRQLRQNLNQYDAHLQETKDEMDASIESWKGRAQELECEVEQLREVQRKLQDSQALERCHEVELEWLRAAKQDLDREVLKLRAQSRAHEADREKLQAAQDENGRLQEAQRELSHRLQELEQSKDNLKVEMERRTAELEIELELGKSIIKKNVEEHRMKTEKLQLAVENARQERDTELTLLRESLARLEAESVDHMICCEKVRAEKAAELLSLQVALNMRQVEVEKLTEVTEWAKRENEIHATKEVELRQKIEYLEGDLHHQAQGMNDREREISKLVDTLETGRMSADNQIAEKEEQIARLGDTVEALKSGLDLELLQVKTKLDTSESEKLQLISKVSMLEAQLEEHVSLMARKLTEREDEIKNLAEAKESLRIKYETENRDLAEESGGLLEVLSRMQSERESAVKEKDSEMQTLIQTMNGALRAKEDELERLRDAAGEAESQRRLIDTLQAELRARAEVERDTVITKKDAELKVLNLTTETLKADLMALKERLRQDDHERDATARQLREKDMEVGKLAQTVDALKTDLSIQKQLLLTFHEGRAYLGAPSDHDAVLRPSHPSAPPALNDLRNTMERTQLPEDGDHRRHQVGRSHQKNSFPTRELKRAASEGDHLDELLSFDLGFNEFLATPSDLTICTMTPSEMSRSSLNPTAEETPTS